MEVVVLEARSARGMQRKTNPPSSGTVPGGETKTLMMAAAA